MSEPDPSSRTMPGPRPEPGLAQDVDLDAQGLPPHVLLPPAAAFKRDQLRARLVVSVIATILLGVLAWVSEQYQTIALACLLASVVATVVMAIRFAIAWRAAADAGKANAS